MSDLYTLLEDLGGFLRRMAAEQEKIGAVVSNAMSAPGSENVELAFALQHFDRTRQNLEAVGEVMAALSTGMAPAAAILPVHLEELKAWLDGDRDRHAGHAGEIDVF